VLVPSTKTRVLNFLARLAHSQQFAILVMYRQRVGGRAGTAAPQGVVCELPNPPDSSFSL
jgi:hypothetical protein